MTKFWLIYVIGAYISYKLVTARKSRELARMQKEERWTQLRITINDLLFPVLNVCGVILVIFFILPLTRDLPNALRSQEENYVGIVEKVECNFFCLKQNVYVILADKDNSAIRQDDGVMKIKVYFNKDVEEGELYEIKYLPKNKFSVNITPISNLIIKEKD